jgi:hypothetical protein
MLSAGGRALARRNLELPDAILVYSLNIRYSD